MSNRRIRLTLLGYLLLIPVIGGLLGGWFALLPKFQSGLRFSGYSIWQGTGYIRHQEASCEKYQWIINETSGERTVQGTVLVLAPPQAGLIIVTAEQPGREPWQREIGCDLRVLEPTGFDPIWRTYPSVRASSLATDYATSYECYANLTAAARLIYDIRENTISLDDASFPASEDSLYVIQFNHQWQPRLTVTDANMNIPGVDANLLQELRIKHQASLKHPWVPTH